MSKVKKTRRMLKLTDDALHAIVAEIAAAYPAGYEFTKAELKDVLHDVQVVASRTLRGIPRAPGMSTYCSPT